MRKIVATAGHRRSARISELEEKARSLAFQKCTQSIASSSSTPPPDAKRRGRKRRSLQAVVVNSVAYSPHQEGEDQKHEDNATISEQTKNMWMPNKEALEFILDIVQRKDTQEMFGQPVDAQEVADYYNIIKEPMDFGTMRAKLHEDMYTSFEQFERNLFLIFSNAMKFNSSTTVYYTAARALSERAQKVIHTFKTEPEKFQLEFSRTRGRPGRKPQSEAAKPAKTGSSKDDVSLHGRSLKRTTPKSRASSFFMPRASQMNNEFLPASRNSRFLDSSGTERRMTYVSKNSFCSENEKILSTAYNASKSLILVTSSAGRYRDSLLQFAKGLGPVAQNIAMKKLGNFSIGAAGYPSLTSIPYFNKSANHYLVPTPTALRISDPPAGSYKGKMICNYGESTILRGEPIQTYTANGGSNPLAGSYKGKMICNYGGPTIDQGEPVPTYTANGGSNPPAGSYKGKMTFNYGGPTINRGKPIPTYTANGGSNPPAGSSKGKMIGNSGGPTIPRGEQIPSSTANAGSVNYSFLEEEDTNRSWNLDGCDCSKTSENMDLLIATLNQISDIQNRNNYTRSGSYYPLTGYEDLPSDASFSHINNTSQSSLLNNRSKHYTPSKLSKTSNAVTACPSATGSSLQASATGSSLQASAFPSSAGSALQASAFPSAAGSSLQASAFPSAAVSSLHLSAFPSAAGSSLQVSAFPSAGSSSLQASAFPSGSSLQASAFPSAAGSSLQASGFPSAAGSSLQASATGSGSGSSLQASWGLPAIRDFAALQPQDNEKIPFSQRGFFSEKQSQVASTQEIPFFNRTMNFLRGETSNRQGYHHQVQLSAQLFWNAGISNFFTDNKQPDLDLQL